MGGAPCCVTTSIYAALIQYTQNTLLFIARQDVEEVELDAESLTGLAATVAALVLGKKTRSLVGRIEVSDGGRVIEGSVGAEEEER